MSGMLIPSGFLLSAGVGGTIARTAARVAGMAIGRLVGGRKGRRKKLDKDKISETAVSTAVRAAFAAGLNLYLKPGINANIRYYLDPPEESNDVAAAERAAGLITRRLSDVTPERIGVDGLPGSGKSTLARALGEQMGLDWVCLDHRLYTSAPVDLSRSGVIYEHHRLFRTQDLDHFDVLVYLDEPLETIERQILNRGRAAAMLDVFDFSRMQAVGQKAFAVAGGEAWRVPNTHAFVKVRPAEGFNERRRLERELKRMGLTETQDLPKEALLFLATFGEAKRGSLAYLQTRQLLKEFLLALGQEITG
ncbi:MAG TPA: hypothetical protein HPP77_10210 [Candidatus Hydrogenedentes bacterium]|nr:hypothetical protein [Candidatus Hydrogenedentota bacterium]